MPKHAIGVGLLELTLVIAVVAAMVLVIGRQFHVQKRDAEIQQVRQSVHRLHEAMVAYYQQYCRTDEVWQSSVTVAELVNKGMLDNPNQIVNPWSGEGRALFQLSFDNVGVDKPFFRIHIDGDFSKIDNATYLSHLQQALDADFIDTERRVLTWQLSPRSLERAHPLWLLKSQLALFKHEQQQNTCPS